MMTDIKKTANRVRAKLKGESPRVVVVGAYAASAIPRLRSGMAVDRQGLIPCYSYHIFWPYDFYVSPSLSGCRAVATRTAGCSVYIGSYVGSSWSDAALQVATSSFYC